MFSSIERKGNIYQLKNVNQFIDFVNNKGKCNIITADGGFDYSKNYNLQEKSSYQLIYSENQWFDYLQ